MRRRLFICNTPYQLIVSVILMNQLEAEADYSEIILTDNFKNSELITKKIEQEGNKKVYFAKINDFLFPKSLKKKLEKAFYILAPKQMVKTCFDENTITQYDEVFYNNDDMFLYNIVFLIAKRNPDVKLFRYEEGYSSYIYPVCSLRGKRITDIRNKIFGINIFNHFLSGVYFFEPELVRYKLDVPFYRIERNINEKVKRNIEVYFDIPKQYNSIEENCIIFEESFAEDIGFTGDLAIYEKINDILNGDIVVKLHPRTKRNRFKEVGIKTLENDGVPWEAVLISKGIQNKKFMAIASGSIINSQILMGNAGESWLLYKCISQNKIPLLNQEFQEFINDLLEKNILKGIIIPESREELYEMMSKRNEKGNI